MVKQIIKPVVCLTILLTAIFALSNVQAKGIAKKNLNIQTSKTVTPIDHSTDQAASHAQTAQFESSHSSTDSSDSPNTATPAIAASADKTETDFLLKKGRLDLENKDYVAAFDAFNKAVSKGSATANALLGNMYLNGLVANDLAAAINDATAFKLYSKAAEQDDADGHRTLLSPRRRHPPPP